MRKRAQICEVAEKYKNRKDYTIIRSKVTSSDVIPCKVREKERSIKEKMEMREVYVWDVNHSLNFFLSARLFNVSFGHTKKAKVKKKSRNTQIFPNLYSWKMTKNKEDIRVKHEQQEVTNRVHDEEDTWTTTTAVDRIKQTVISIRDHILHNSLYVLLFPEAPQESRESQVGYVNMFKRHFHSSRHSVPEPQERFRTAFDGSNKKSKRRRRHE